MASRPAPRPKAKAAPSRPTAAHSKQSSRPYRRIVESQKWNKL